MNQYTIIISSKAHSDIAECVSLIKKVSIEAARSFTNDIYASIATLNVFPERNALFEMPKSFPFDVRKLIVNNRYIVLYAFDGECVVVYRVIDSRKKFTHLI